MSFVKLAFNFSESHDTVFEGSLWVKSGLIGLILINQLFAYTLLPLIIWYEKHGEDPLKRTIFNQLFSSACIDIILINVFPTNFILARLIYGHPFNAKFIYYFYFCLKSTICIAGLLVIIEYVIIRFLAICAWKRLPPFNDLFFGTYFDMLNLTLSAFFAGLQNFCQVSPDYMMYFLTGQHEDLTRPAFRYHTNLLPFLVVLFYLTDSFILGFTIFWFYSLY